MNDLLQISTSTIGAEQVNSVNAREIHEYLEVKTRFDKWIQRAIERYDFLENLDFLTIAQKRPTAQGNTTTSKEYIVSLDMAKELSMLENNPKGKETRKYFINFEKNAKTLIQDQSSELILLKGMLASIEKMNDRVTSIESTKRLENWQEKRLIDVKNKKVYEIAEKHDLKNDSSMIKKLHRGVWKSLKNKFSIPRYNELAVRDFDNGISFINSLNLRDII